jgi:hypothetical protein
MELTSREIAEYFPGKSLVAVKDTYNKRLRGMCEDFTHEEVNDTVGFADF